MKSSTPGQPFQAFMDGLIDYAGLFPPASLDLTSALDEYGAEPGAERCEFEMGPEPRSVG